MLYVLVVRHGDAEAGELGRPDSARHLTDYGREVVKAQAKRVKEWNMEIGEIIHSPYIRAIETAEILNRELGSKLGRAECLVPAGNPNDLVHLVLGQSSNLMLVSHLPLVDEFCREFTGQGARFLPGTIAKIAVEDPYSGKGRLVDIYMPGKPS